MASNALQMMGAQPSNPSRGRPIHVARMETGLFTNRSAIHDTAQYTISKFYGGYIDALLSGSNMEVSNQLTVIRRPGLTAWSTSTVPNPPLSFYEFRRLDTTIDVMVDTYAATYYQTPTTQTQIFTKTLSTITASVFLGTVATITAANNFTVGQRVYVQGSTNGGGELNGWRTVTACNSAQFQFAFNGTTFSSAPDTGFAGAGPGYYVGVGNTLYYGDGIDLQQWNGSLPIAGNVVSNWGIAAPTVAPSFTITESSSAASTWVANTIYSTMGLLIDGNGNVQQLIATSGGASANLGTTGSGQPVWNQTPGLTTADGAWSWTNWGPIGLWVAGALYQNGSSGGIGGSPCIIYDPQTTCCFVNIQAGGVSGNAGTNRPKFPATFKGTVGDNVITWMNLGTLKRPQAWQPSHSYPTLGSVSFDDSVSGIAEPTTLESGYPSTTVYWQVNHTGSTQTSSASATSPFLSTLAFGDPTVDGNLTWMCLGSGTRQINHAYIGWTANKTAFSVIKDSNNNFQVCTTGGTSSGTATGSISWGTSYNQTTQDGGVVWTCVGGGGMTWAANTQWYLPTSGWFPPSGGTPYGGVTLADNLNPQNIQTVVSSGKSGAGPGQPAWSGTLNGQITDNTVTWRNIGVFSALGFAWQSGYSYAFSYEARLATDQYNTTTPPDWKAPLGNPTGSMTGHISTASPLATFTGANPGAVVNLSGPGSCDPQVDTIVIWRTADGGSDLFFLTEIPNPGCGQTWTLTDSQPDTTLNELIPAPIAGANNPPPAGFIPMAYHFGRIWGAVGNTVYCSGGGDTVAGDPNEAFNPSDFFEFPSPVTRIIPTATGILIFLTSDVYAIQGGPAFVSFYPTPLIPGVGLLHYWAIDIHGGVLYLFTADSQFLAIDPSGGVNRLGQAIADKLQSWNPNNVFVTVHESGNDNAIFIADGATGWYRLNPAQFPNGTPVWSLFATITGGAGAVQSMEVSKGVHRLLVGGTSNNQLILQRDFSTYQDNGSSYTCSAVMGSINLCNPGQIAGGTFVNLRCTKTGTTPTVSFLLNEVSGSFTTFPYSVPYPWQVYGLTLTPSSMYANAYYFNSAAVPALMEHCQVQWQFPAENFANEVLSLTIYGTIEQSPES